MNTVRPFDVPFQPFHTTQHKFVNLTGQRFGRLHVISIYGKTHGSALWLCRCICNDWSVTRGAYLQSGKTTSCGCYVPESVRANKTTHGYTTKTFQPTEYRIYHGAKNRCVNPNTPAFKDYGGRGIEFRFQSFEEFLNEIGPRPSKAYSLDRKNNNGHYAPGNVRWATRLEQGRNKRDVISITAQGKTMLLSEWAEITGIPGKTLHQRLTRQKWCPECIVGIPLKHRHQNKMCRH